MPIAKLLYPWTRYWLPIGSSYFLDEFGFPFFNIDSSRFIDIPNKHTLKELDQFRCLILLGEPGMGKSTEINEYKNSNDLSLQCVFTLNSRSSERELFNSIENQSNFNLWLNKGGNLFLYLDGLDEAYINIKSINKSLVDWIFDNKDRFNIDGSAQSIDRGLYLRITCRSAIWSADLTKKLEQIFGTENVKTYELAPLTQQEIRITARHEKIDEDKFIEAIVESGTTSFAVEPITLKFLVDQFNSGDIIINHLDKKRLFHLGCLRLCEELNSTYQPHVKLSASQRLTIASRIALYQLISKKTAICKTIGTSTENDLLLDSVAGDHLKIDGFSDSISILDLNEVINTGLFTLIDSDRYGFKHKAFAEFLAASHLNQLNVSPKQVSQILISPHDPFKVIPELNEVVIWLATLDQSIFDLLIDHDPLLLIRCNKFISDINRSKLVKSILELSKNYELLDSYDSNKFYKRLDHPSLNIQLKSIIINKSINTVSRRIAIRIAGSCQQLMLVNLLLKIIETKEEDTNIRKEAILAINEINNEDSFRKLLNYFELNLLEDKDDELKGSTLKILYPRLISTDKMLEALSEVKSYGIYGSYKSFLENVGNLIPDNDLIVVLRFQSRKEILKDNRRNPFKSLIDNVVKRCWNLPFLDEGIILFSELVWKLRKSHISFEIPDSAPNRKQVIKIIIEQITDSSDIYYLVGRFDTNTYLIIREDWNWLIEFVYELGKSYEEKISRILWMIMDFNSAKQINDFLILVHNNDQLLSLYKDSISPIDIYSNEALTLKKNLALQSGQAISKRKPKQRLLTTNAQEKCRELIKLFSKSDISPFWKLSYYLSIDEENQTWNDLEFDLTHYPTWNLIEDIHHLIIEAAKIFVTTLTPKSKWILSNSVQRPELSGYKALLLLLKFDFQFVDKLESEFWEKWAPTVIYCSFNTLNELTDDRKYILKKCFATNHRNNTYNRLIRYLAYRLEKGQELYDLHKIKSAYSELLAEALLKLATHKYCNIDNQEHILDFLLENKSHLVKTKLIGLFNKLVNDKIAPEKIELGILASSKLLINPHSDWSHFWSVLKRSKYSVRIFLRAASHLGFGRTRHIELLNSKQRSEILIWLYKHFPPNQDPIHKHLAYSPTDLDNVIDYRNQVLRSLVSEGTLESVQSLKKVYSKIDQNEAFKWNILSARVSMRKNSWLPPIPEDLKLILNDFEKRYIRSELELLKVVMESLERLQHKLQGKNPTAYFIWNRYQGGKKNQFAPKDENTLSDFLQMHFEYDLIERKIIINREVEIKRSTGNKDGARTDLFVQATKQGNQKDHLSLVIEVKGCWNPDLNTSMELQLKSKYLSKHRCNIGIYLVGWYYCSHYKPTKALGITTTRRVLERQALQLSIEDVTIKSFVLDCRL